MTRRSVSALAIVLTAALAVEGEFISARQNQPAGAAQPGPGELTDAERLQQEGERHIEARQYKEAGPKLEEALRIRKQRLGESHPDVAQSIGRLATVAYYLGDYARAESLAAEALKIREATLGANHTLVAESLSDLASMYLVRGDYVRPEPLFLRALAIHDAAPAAAAAEARTLLADVLNNLALLYSRRGDFERAESNYLRVIAIRESARGADDPSVAEAVANLGGVYYAAVQYPKAIETLTRALRIQEKNLPAEHPALATSSFNLAAVYFAQGDYASAEALFQRALTIDERAVNPQHPRLAIRLHGLAELLRLKGEYARAEPLYERAMTIRDQALGQGHPLFAETVIGRSLLRYARGEVTSAVELLERGAALREDTVALVLAAGTESEKRLYLRTLDDESEIALTLHLRDAPTVPRAAALALTHVVQRKGRSIDATTDHMAALRSRLDDDTRELLARRGQAQGRLATLVLRGVSTDDQRKAVEALRAEVQQIEQSISSRSSEFRAVQRTTLADVQTALPVDAVLLEFVAYRPFLVRNPRRTAFAAPHYAVYALRRDGIVASADLGEVAVVDREVERLRVALSTANGRDARPAAQALYRRLVAPVTAAIADAQRLVISPDGALNLIPFAAVMTDEGRYLVESHAISYVTSGRDLARLRRPGDTPYAVGSPVVIANPSFDGMRVPAAVTTAASRAVDQARLDEALKFDPLPGTGEEAAAIAKLLTEPRVLTGAAATEAALKQVTAPAILHIATHGFFLGTAKSSPATARGLTATPAQGGPPSGAGEDALLMSGLAMAGANQRWSGEGEDGILTALEATSLNLRGTRLVVLSACETGIGDARRGEGVYGLRRALVLAGSESQVMSLWQVSDTATRDLMIAYYRRLRAGEGRADALRQVQLDMLRTDAARAHPFYWASFIQSGDWRPAFD